MSDHVPRVVQLPVRLGSLINKLLLRARRGASSEYVLDADSSSNISLDDANFPKGIRQPTSFCTLGLPYSCLDLSRGDGEAIRTTCFA